MGKIYTVFLNRNQAMIFYNCFIRYAKASIVNTPSALATSCSVSVVINENCYDLACKIIFNEKIVAFKNFYIERISNGIRKFEIYKAMKK